MRPAVQSQGSLPNLSPSDPSLLGRLSGGSEVQRSIEALTEEDDRQERARSEYLAYRSLVERAVDVFGDEIKASLWLSRPSPDLEGKSPLQEAQRLHYAPADMDRLFEPIFVRIEEGIYW